MAASPPIPAPTAIVINTVSESQLAISWADNSANETRFVVARAVDGSRFSVIAELPVGTTSCVDAGLLPLTKYRYRVSAATDMGASKWSRVGKGITSSWLAATASPTLVSLSWNDYFDGERGFNLDRATDQGRFRRIASLSAGATAFTDTDVAPNTAYRYRIKSLGGTPRLRRGTASVSTPLAPQALLISEDFSSGAGGFTPVDGQWSATGGAYAVSAENGAATTHLNSRSVHAAAVAGDFTLEVDARAEAAGVPWSNFSVIFGYQDAQNYYFFSSNQSNDAATSGIFRVVNGNSTELADVPAAITPGTTYQLRVERSGDQIRAYRDGTLVASAADGTFQSGRVGLGVRQFRATFDNLTVTAAAAPTAPAAPSALAASVASSSQINLTWSDTSTNESGFKVERSDDGGSTWSQVATVGAGATSYAATGLSASTAYSFRVRAYNAAGDSAYSNIASATTPAAPQPGALASPPQAAVDAAIAAPLIRYHRDLPGGAHTQGAFFGGASVTLAVAAYAGNASADARLLEQARYTLTGGNDISANGGYPAQHERHVTGMFALMRLTPRVWNQLTAAERQKVDLLVKASLVAGAFTTSDNNPYIASGQQERALDGDTNLSRDWNPNYREGMVGSVLVAAAYFGPAQAQAVLAGYDHAAFVAELAAAGLANIHQTFNWRAANPSSIAPDAATIQAAARAGYRYYGLPITDVMGIYGRLLDHTYGERQRRFEWRRRHQRRWKDRVRREHAPEPGRTGNADRVRQRRRQRAAILGPLLDGRLPPAPDQRPDADRLGPLAARIPRRRPRRDPARGRQHRPVVQDRPRLHRLLPRRPARRVFHRQRRRRMGLRLHPAPLGAGPAAFPPSYVLTGACVTPTPGCLVPHAALAAPIAHCVFRHPPSAFLSTRSISAVVGASK